MAEHARDRSERGPRRLRGAGARGALEGFWGPTNFNGSAFETYTWAAGLAAATTHISLFSTSHVLTTHPIVAAKQSATIDHISNGRFALNVVCGWFQDEFDMFGLSLRDHDALYDYAAEWLAIVRRLWSTEREWEFEGRFSTSMEDSANPSRSSSLCR